MFGGVEDLRSGIIGRIDAEIVRLGRAEGVHELFCRREDFFRMMHDLGCEILSEPRSRCNLSVQGLNPTVIL